MNDKKYYWLKLKDDFFNLTTTKLLRRMPEGDKLTIIYLKLQLLSLKNNGSLTYTRLLPNLAEELAIAIDEDHQYVALTLATLEKLQLIQSINNDEYLLLAMNNLIGAETKSAKQKREYRKKIDEITNKEYIPPKSTAQRQEMYRAKKNCESKQHIPYIENHTNNKRYGGNYYLVMNRDNFKCANCSSIEKLCVHHIDGYDELKPNNNKLNKMITLCRTCHSNVHVKNETSQEL